jgi:rhodanese-related sulfurtransferase
MNAQEFYQHKLAYEIDSWDLYTALTEGQRVIVVDARSAESFEREYIPGAVSFPHRAMNETSVIKLDRDVLYVTYCDGIGCNASTKGALKLSTFGFQVKELLGGLDWWKRDGYATAGTQASEGRTLDCGC